MNIKKLENYHDDFPLPRYETAGSSGIDLRACVENVHPIPPGGKQTIPCGIAIELPALHEGQVRSRSGLGTKSGINVINSPGTIDADYRGEIKVTLINLGKEYFQIEPGMRVAQLVISPVVQVELDFVEELGNTERGDGGHGSTGTE